MRIRKVLEALLFVCFGLFFLFSVIDFQLSVEIVLFLVITLVGFKIYELLIIRFGNYNRKLLGSIELFRSNSWNYVVSIIAIILLYLVLKYHYLLKFETNAFTNFFFDPGSNHFAYYIISVYYVIGLFINDNRIFYFTEQGLVTKGNYFEDYLWQDFKEFSIIEEQYLIRFKKKNNKFLFVKYQERYFEEINSEILKVLKKYIKYV